ncbi:MAG: tetratricopeptide repeat protein [Candidatus Obscuribacterales bacterium]
MIDFKGITQDIAAPSSQSGAGSSSGAVQVELRQAVDYFKMAMEYLTQGRFDDAEQLYRMALNVSETATTPRLLGI